MHGMRDAKNNHQDYGIERKFLVGMMGLKKLFGDP